MLKLSEVFNIDIDVGDLILMGKFKNKKVKIKTLSYDELNQPVVNGKKMLTFRIAKKMPKKDGEKK